MYLFICIFICLFLDAYIYTERHAVQKYMYMQVCMYLYIYIHTRMYFVYTGLGFRVLSLPVGTLLPSCGLKFRTKLPKTAKGAVPSTGSIWLFKGESGIPGYGTHYRVIRVYGQEARANQLRDISKGADICVAGFLLKV